MDEKTEKMAEELYVKIEQIMEHGDPEVRALIRDLVHEFHAQMMADPKARVQMKQRVQNLREKVIRLPFRTKPAPEEEKPDTPASPRRTLTLDWGIVVGLVLGALIFLVPWKDLLPSDAQKPPVKVCNIKGNISESGEKIYHVPSGEWYDKTYIEEAKGDRWFCSESAARAEGWRRAEK